MDAGAHNNRSYDRSPIPGAVAPIESPQKSKKTTLYIPIVNISPQKADRGICIYLLGYLVSAK